jgi:hypothetical protein
MKVWQGGAVPPERQASEVSELRIRPEEFIIGDEVRWGLSENPMLDNNLPFRRGHMSPAIKATAIFLSICCYAESAGADTFVRTVPPGHAALMHQYTSWRESDCASVSGVVQLSSKPQHGRLITNEVDVILRGRNRFTGSMKCAGRLVHMFQVYYEPNAGYHGADSFSIDARYGAIRRKHDYYRIMVQ